MEIRGSIEEESVEKIIKVIADLEETGILVIKTENSEGKISFENGRVLYASFNDSYGKDAFVKLINVNEGEYQFINREKVDEVNIKDITIDEMVSYARKHSVDEEEELEEELSPRAMIWRKTSEISTDVTINSDEWRFLSNIRDGRSIRDISANLGIDIEEAKEIAKVLKKKELIEIEEPLFTKEIPLVVPVRTPAAERALDPMDSEYKTLLNKYGKMGIEFLIYANGKRFVGQITALLGVEQAEISELFKSLAKDGYLKES